MSAQILEALWAEIIVRAEAFHDRAVLGQRAARAQTAMRLSEAANDLSALARAAALLAPPPRSRR